jgi:hypothetical protein
VISGFEAAGNASFSWQDETVERLAEFLCAGGSGDVMTNHTAKTVGFHWRHFSEQLLNQCASNRNKSVSIIEAKRRKLVALATYIKRFSKCHFAVSRTVPKFFGRPVTFGCWFMQGVFFFAQTGVNHPHRLKANLATSAASF